MEKIKPELVDELLKGYEKPEDIIGENGLLKRLVAADLPHDLHDQCGGIAAYMSLRKIIKTRGSFPSEEAATKLLYLALRNASAK